MKVLVYDLETSPNLGWVWGKYEQNVLEYEQEWHIMTIAWKWLGEKKTHVLGLDDFDLYKKDPTDDFGLVLKLHELFDQADVLIAHNGDTFDKKKAHARFLYHDMTPPSPTQTIDTLKIARKHFKFNSNKLDDLGEHLKLGRKVSTGGFKLWMDCMKGDPKAWAKMKRYNKQDVVLLEDIYYKLRPWITSHPSVALADGRPMTCPNCGAPEMELAGMTYTKTATYERFQCGSCKAWSRSRKKLSTGVMYVN